jgi:diguanylate cyclase (GGDEF)-like protein
MSSNKLGKLERLSADKEAAAIDKQLAAARLVVEKSAELEANQAQERVDLLIKQREQQRLKQELELQKQLATKDVLTGLDNRRAFHSNAEELEADLFRYPDRQASVALIDLDKFKKINDGYGHAVGDTVLARAGEIILENSRATDKPARYGGEEFAVLLPMTTEEEALTYVEHLRATFSADPVLQAAVKGERPVTISAGVAQLDPKKPDVTEAINWADQSLYAAKDGSYYQGDTADPRADGRNQVIAYSQLGSRQHAA